MTERTARSPLAAGIAILLLATAALFVIGASIERNSAAEHTETSQGASDPIAGEGTAAHEEQEGAGTGEGQSAAHTDGSGKATEAVETEPLAPLEAPAAAVGLVVVSILLAAAVYFRPSRLALAVVAIVTVVAASLDVVELIHQVKEAREGIAVLVAVILLLRIATLAGTARLWKRLSPAGTI